MGGDDHRCEWRDEVESLRAEVAELRAQFAKLQRHAFGKRSEKMPSVAEELRRAGATAPDPEAAQAKRRANAEKKKALPVREIVHEVPEEKKVCPKCGSHDFTPLGKGKVTTIYEYIPARFERQLHIQEKVRCRCGETILTAEGPPRAYDKAEYATVVDEVLGNHTSSGQGPVRWVAAECRTLVEGWPLRSRVYRPVRAAVQAGHRS